MATTAMTTTAMTTDERIVQRFMDYVRVDSESFHEAAFATLLAKELQSLGLSVEFDNSQEKTGSDTGNLIARLPGRVHGPVLLFSCHLDTVQPGIGIKPLIKDDRITSDGTTILGGDDKAGIAAIMEALHIVREKNIPHGPLEIVFSVCEEQGLRGSRALDTSMLGASMAFVLDAGGDVGDIVLQGPAQEKMEIVIHGKEAHAGEAPEKGISAIYLAAKAISKMKLFRIDEETTANIGHIEGGGATNIIPAKVRLRAEARSLSEEKLCAQVVHMADTFRDEADCAGGRADVSHELMYPAFVHDKNSVPVQLAYAAAVAAGLKPAFIKTGGGSDTNIFNAKGLSAVTLGIAERNAHTKEEYIAVADLLKARDLVLAIIAQACKGSTIKNKE